MWKKFFSKKEEIMGETPMPQNRVIVGLGNPGKEYARTRHNVGFAVVDSLAGQLGIDVTAKKFGGLVGQGRYQDKKLIVVKPQQYMNCSGQVVASVLGFYKLAISELIVVADDMALEPGMIRLRGKGSAGGHNGLADIVAKLGSDEFARLRVGIGKSAYPDARDYVLGEPSKEEKEMIAEGVKNAHQALLCWLDEGLERTMNKFN